jgi:putative tryptophan/tyrosine transport system substrate-binding protein
VRRREFIGLVCGTAVWPLAAGAQQPRKVVGMLWLTDPTLTEHQVRAFLKGLRDLGWIEGHNFLIEGRWARSADMLPALAAELVRIKVDIIYAPASPQVGAIREATDTIPIVFGAHGDPVGAGHVASLAHPGGNATGLSNLLTELSVKGLEILKETIPQTARIGILWDPTSPAAVVAQQSLDAAAKNFGLLVHMTPVRSVDEFDGAMSRMARAGVGAFLGVTSPLTYTKGVELAEIALRYRLAGIFSARINVVAGALMSYGPNFEDLHRRAAGYVDKILRGAKPADLPVEQASKYELNINLKTAKALGLTIPPALLARADEVIE